MTNVLVLGASGMLGSMVVDVLSQDPDIALTGTYRRTFDALRPSENPSLFADQNWIINCIGITKPLIHDDNPAEVETAIAVNSALPHQLGKIAAAHGARVLQIATDCVYSGAKGDYVEQDPHDALDVYGKTKSLGEAYLPSMSHLRCSIIGPEPKDFKSLLEWFRRQPASAQLNGFTNHRWNGLTTLHFARICLGIIRNNIQLPHLTHVVPSGSMTKAQMLIEFKAAFDRCDIHVREMEASTLIDRTLATTKSSLNDSLWKAAGYEQPPSIREMIEELGDYDYRSSTVHTSQ